MLINGAGTTATGSRKEWFKEGGNMAGMCPKKGKMPTLKVSNRYRIGVGEVSQIGVLTSVPLLFQNPDTSPTPSRPQFDTLSVERIIVIYQWFWVILRLFFHFRYNFGKNFYRALKNKYVSKVSNVFKIRQEDELRR